MTLGAIADSDSETVLNTLFVSSVSGIVLPISDHLDALHTSEREIVRNASKKRQLEFSTGRYCAKTVLSNLGVEHFPVLRNEQREPLWPEGFVGSISHCRDLCGAVVAKNSDLKAIGFDIENIKALKQDIVKLTCTSHERQWLTQQTIHSYDTLVILLFSLKEAVFKCVFPHQKIQLSFKDCEIKPNFASNTAAIYFHHKTVSPDIVLKFQITEQHIYSGAYYR